MKKCLTVIIALLAIQVHSYAQWLYNGTHIYNSNTGNVGISSGASFTPSHKLEVRAPNGDGIRISGNSGETSANLFLYPSSASSSNRNWVISAFHDALGDFVIKSSNAAGGNPYTTGTTRFSIRNNGNVGIGISSSIPTANLHLGNDLYISASSATWNSTAGKGLFMRYSTNNGQNAAYIQSVDRTTGTLYPMYIYGSHTIIPNKVVIGYPDLQGLLTEDYHLSVKGAIRAESVKVYLSGTWADYVFDDSYHLKPLNEVEQFINENKHLPDVPSAAEVEKKGVDLGSMDATLLRKIEELTLYMIEQNKQLQELKKENELLKNKVSHLENK